MRIDTPDARKAGDYGIYVGRLQYGDPEATIHLDENGGLDLRRVTLDDCDRLIRAAAAAKQEILVILAETAVPHGTQHIYQGTCQLCGKPEDDGLHAEPVPLQISDETIRQAAAFAEPGNTIDDVLAEQRAAS